MMSHPSHEFPPPSADAWRCLRCGCLPTSQDARLRCVPVRYEDDSRAEYEGWMSGK